MRPLTARQSRFVNAYMTGISAAEAARQAGYGPGYSAKAAKYLLQHPSIAAAIQEVQVTLQSKTLFDAEALVKECDELIRFGREKNNPMSCVKALELKARAHGLLTDRLELAAPVDLRGALHEARSRVVARGLAVRVLPVSDAVDPFGD